MTGTEIWLILAAFGILGILMWLLQRWDERRIDRSLEKKYQTSVGPKHLLTWDEKKASLEDALKRSHETTDTQDFMP